MNTNEIMQKALKTMSNEDKAAIWPPLSKKELCSQRVLARSQPTDHLC